MSAVAVLVSGRAVGLTEGGEALTSDGPKWCAIWTHSHCEQLVHEQLTHQLFESFLPTIRQWSRRAGVRRLIAVPMFPGYLFVHHAMDKHACTDILKTRGVVRILGERWDRLAVVPDEEIAALRHVAASELPVMGHAYLREGQRVRITDGPLSGVEGIFVRGRPNRGLLVLSVELLHQSVAVEVDCTIVKPVGSAAAA